VIPQHNPDEEPPQSARQALNNVQAVSGIPQQTLVCGVGADREKLPGSNRKLIRHGPLFAGLDALSYDLANVTVAKSNIAQGEAVAQCWVEYKIKFYGLRADGAPPLNVNQGMSWSIVGVTGGYLAPYLGWEWNMKGQFFGALATTSVPQNLSSWALDPVPKAPPAAPPQFYIPTFASSPYVKVSVSTYPIGGLVEFYQSTMPTVLCGRSVCREAPI